MDAATRARLAQQRHGHGERSADWWGFEQALLAEASGCAACLPGIRRGGLQVHHIVPFHYAVALGRPDLEFDRRNLIVLCETERKGDPAENHHLLLGHAGNFRLGNLWVADDAALFRGMSGAAIKADPRWQARRRQAVKPLDRMDEAERALFRHLMDQRFGIAIDDFVLHRLGRAA